jgi:hypothetical protein
MKTKNSSSRPRDQTQGETRYCNIYIEFPDGEVWSDSIYFAGGLAAWITNTRIWKNKPDLARNLMLKGEAHWKQSNGVVEHWKIEEKPCSRKWGKPGQIKRSSKVNT